MTIRVRLRRWLIASLTVAALVFFVAKLMQVQVIDAAYYQSQINYVTSRTQTVRAVRGEIVDRQGRPLAENRMGYDVIIDKALFPADRLSQNETLHRLVAMCERLDVEWNDNLPLAKTAPFDFVYQQAQPTFIDDPSAADREEREVPSGEEPDRQAEDAGDESETPADEEDGQPDVQGGQAGEEQESSADPTTEESEPDSPDGKQEQAARVSRLIALLGLQGYATADNVMDALIQRYRLEDYSREDARKLAGICYEMEQKGFSLNTPYVFASNIPIESVIRIKERSFELPGVDVDDMAVRTYEEGDLAPHIIGLVGAIYEDEYTALKEAGKIYKDGAEEFDRDGYFMDDTIGKGGVEGALEQYLRGKTGKREIYVNSSGQVVDTVETISPEPGNTVVLTLDRHLQRTAQDALEAQILFLQENYPAGQGKEADSGAVVAIDCKTGEILAAATYPSYDLNTYLEDYAELAQDTELAPLLNRAFSGEYTPGSTFKPTVALAGLDTGVIDAASGVYCGMVYTFYPDYQPKCLSAHGSLNVLSAISYSCNIFFYDTGRRAGIDAINETALQLGLGAETGLEIPEKSGQLSFPALKEEQTGEPWSGGDVLQASIGQMLNKFTPLQLANYAATIGNRGIRMKATIVHEVRDYSQDQVVVPFQPQVANQSSIDAAHYETVVEGMVRTSRSGTSYGYFGNYPVDVASKTGTPETADLPNSTFICFAPAEDPQVAIAVVIENGWHGYTGAPVAKAIFDEYFGYDVNSYNNNGWDQLRAERKRLQQEEEARAGEEQDAAPPQSPAGEGEAAQAPAGSGPEEPEGGSVSQTE